MQAFVDFIQAYFPYLSAGIMILIEVLSIILKKRPKTLDDFVVCLEKVLNHLPVLINDAENVLLSSKDKSYKKSCVLNNAMVYFSHLLKRDISPYECDFAEKAISEQIEVILTTPQKKGVLNESKS